MNDKHKTFQVGMAQQGTTIKQKSLVQIGKMNSLTPAVADMENLL